MSDEKTDIYETGETRATDGGLLSSRRFVVAVGAATLAFIAAVVFGVLWWSTTSTGEYEVSSGREAVLEAAKDGVLAYTAIDHTKPDDYRNSQKAISTDDLNDQMAKGWTKARKQIVDNKLSVKVTVEELGISKLDTHKGDAEALAAIKITRSAEGEKEQSALLRMIAKLKRVGEEWKLADIAEAPEIGSA